MLYLHANSFSPCAVHYEETCTAPQNAGPDDVAMVVRIDVDDSDDNDEVSSQFTGTPSLEQYPWGPGPL